MLLLVYSMCQSRWAILAVCLALLDMAGAAPSIDVWYGGVQEFGRIGTPQPYVNILGSVGGGQPVASASYRVNGGAWRSLGIGPDSMRLHAAGDFNADIPFSQLGPGANSVEIAARDNAGASSSTTVTVYDSSGAIWPLPYTVDWSRAASINSVAQVTDGRWTRSGGSVRPTAAGYDRLIVIGDQGWQDYEVTVPITVHSISPDGYGPPANGPAVGLLVRWPGHFDDGRQPRSGIYPLGAIGLYRWTQQSERFELFGNHGTILAAAPTTERLPLGRTYIFKVRVETSGSAGQYSFKYWPQGTNEPSSWQLTGRQFNDPGRGCMALLTHYVDASFGYVAVGSPGGGSLRVTLAPADAVNAGARWRRTGTDIWHYSGETEPGVPPGDHAVEFSGVSEWVAPPQQQVRVNAGQTTSAQAMYVPQKGSLRVAIGPPDAIVAGAQWRRAGTTAWGDSGNTEPEIPAGEYTVEFKPLEGWAEPFPQTVTVAGGQTTTLSVDYFREVGHLRVELQPPEIAQLGGRWRRAGTLLWGQSGDIERGIPTGEYQVEFAAVPYWHTPSAMHVTITNNTTLSVTASYARQVGSLQVTIEPGIAARGGAKWRRVGTTEWLNSGDIEAEIPAGEYAVEFQDLTGWHKPPELAVEVQEATTGTAVGTYARKVGSLTAAIAPAEVADAGAMWRVVGAMDWLPAGEIRSDLPVGQYSVEYSSLSGWRAPDPQDVVLTETETTVVQGTYVRQRGSLGVIISPPSAVEAGAAWQREGQPEWRAADQPEIGIPVDAYNIAFKPLVNWHTPDPQTVEIRDGETTTIQATYLPHAGYVQVFVDPEAAAAAGASWRMDGGEWQVNGTTVDGVTVGEHSIEFADLDGYDAPASQVVVVDLDRTTFATGTYALVPMPMAADLEVVVCHETPTPIQLSAEDPADLPLTFSIASPPQHGSIEAFDAIGGTLSYTPAAGYSGSDAFTFAADNGRQADKAVVHLSVSGPLSSTSAPACAAAPVENAEPSPNSPDPADGATDASENDNDADSDSDDDGDIPGAALFTLTITTTDGATPPADTAHQPGSVVEVTAPVPQAGYAFSHWSGDLTSDENPLTVTIDGDLSLVANYVRQSLESSDPTQTGNVPPSGADCGLGALAGLAGMIVLRLTRGRKDR